MNCPIKVLYIICSMSFFAVISLHAGEIHDAVAAGNLTRIKTLIEVDSTLLDVKDSVGNTPLIIACRTTQVAIAKYLIDKGANVNTVGFLKMTPLQSIKMSKDESFEIAKCLIAKGANVNAENINHWTIFCSAALSDNLKIAKLLIDHGADLNYRWQGMTILQIVISEKLFYNDTTNGKMAAFLIENGAKLQSLTYGYTELHLASLNGLADIAQLLMKHGADVNAVNEFNHTPLYYAAKHGYRKTAEILIAAGANKSAIVEANYGNSQQLTETLKDGEAHLWYLGGLSPGTGYAVKTKQHLIVFDPFKIDRSLETGLASGYLNPNELIGQNITILVTREAQNSATVTELAKAFPNADFVYSFKPIVDSMRNEVIPQYHPAIPNESFSIGDIQIHTIRAMKKSVTDKITGLGYLVEVDGLKILHSGLHASQKDSLAYRKEIDFLKPFGPIDIVIFPIKGHHINLDYKQYLYLLDQLTPKAIYLIGDDRVVEEQKECPDFLRARNIPVLYPEGGISMGERFHYIRDGK